VKPEKEGDFAMELNLCSVDRQVECICDTWQAERVVSEFWAHVLQLKTFDVQRYPTLSMLVYLLTLFSGLLIERSCNIIGDIIEENRTKLSLENNAAVAIV